MKIKEFFKKHKNLWLSIVDILLTIMVFFLGLFLGSTYCEPKSASAEEVDIRDEGNEVQPPSVLFEAIYEGGTTIPLYLISPSTGTSTSYAGQWTLNEDYYGVSGSYLYTTPIEGLQGLISLQYGGYASASSNPTYKFTFSNIYTHFTDQFEWGYVETSSAITSATFEFEIYDYRNKKTDFITHTINYVSPSYHIIIDPSRVLAHWGENNDVPYLQYFVVVGSGQTAIELAYVRSYSVSFTSTTRDETFYIGYTGNLNSDVTAYMNAMQDYGESKTPPTELDGLFVFNSIIDAVDRFMGIEILPNFSFYDLLYIALGIPLTIWLLKLWLGG